MPDDHPPGMIQVTAMDDRSAPTPLDDHASTELDFNPSLLDLDGLIICSACGDGFWTGSEHAEL
jgi:hypothetical protein